MQYYFKMKLDKKLPRVCIVKRHGQCMKKAHLSLRLRGAIRRESPMKLLFVLFDTLTHEDPH